MDRRVFFGMLLVLCFYQISESRPRSLIERLTSAVSREADPDFYCDDLVCAMERVLIVVALDFNRHVDVTFQEIAIHLTGIDVFDHSDLQVAVCRITEATTRAQLLSIYKELGIAVTALEFAYGAATAYLPVAIQGLEVDLDNANEPHRANIEALLDILYQIQDENLDTLHPDATDFACRLAPNTFECGGVQEESKRSYYKKRGVVKRTTSCDRLYGNIATLIDALDNANGQNGEIIKDKILQNTGIDLNNDTLVRELACAILDITSVGDLLYLMDTAGVTPPLFNTLYEERMVTMSNEARTRCEEGINAWEQGVEGIEEEVFKCQHVYLPYADVCEASGLLDLQ